jgi:hypothetical protein
LGKTCHQLAEDMVAVIRDIGKTTKINDSKFKKYCEKS